MHSDRAQPLAKCGKFPVAVRQPRAQLLGGCVIVICQRSELGQLGTKSGDLGSQCGNSLHAHVVSATAAPTETPHALSDIGVISIHRVP